MRAIACLMLMMISSRLSLVANDALASDAAAVAQDGMFIHVSDSDEDPHRLLMAFKMAPVMAESGRPVLVYCDIRAVTVLASGARDITHPHFPSAHSQLKEMPKAGGRIRACPS